MIGLAGRVALFFAAMVSYSAWLGTDAGAHVGAAFLFGLAVALILPIALSLLLRRRGQKTAQVLRPHDLPGTGRQEPRKPRQRLIS